MDSLEKKVDKKTIAIDAMTAEAGVEVLCSAVRNYTCQNPDVQVVLFGNHDLFEQDVNVQNTRCEFVSGVLDAHMPFMEAFKDRENSTWKTVEYVRDGKADAGISFGRTDAVVAFARNLRRIGGARRSPLGVFLPSLSSKEGYVLLTDVGAFSGCDALDLMQFAIMSSCFYELKSGRKARVGLLNMGTEEHKGKGLVPETHELLKRYAERDEDFRYKGYVEGWDIYKPYNGEVDVILMDGVTGNHIIKTSRGLANFARHELKRSFYKNFITKAGGILYKLGGGEKQLQGTLNPDQYGGAYFLGLEKLFVKGHGSSNEDAMKTAIQRAYECNSVLGLYNSMLVGKLCIARKIAVEAGQK